MKEKVYSKAVDAIHAAIKELKDENVQEVWDVISDIWADYEQEVYDRLEIK